MEQDKIIDEAIELIGIPVGFEEAIEAKTRAKKIIEKLLIDAKIEQSWRCRELIEANANSPEDAERYGEIVLLDIDDLKEDKVALNG